MPSEESQDNAKKLIDTVDELREDAKGKLAEAFQAAYDAQIEYMKASSAYATAGTNYALGQISAADYSSAVETFVKAAGTWTTRQHWADAANTFFQNSASGLVTAQTQLMYGQIEEAEQQVPGVIELLKSSIRFAEATRG